MCARVTKIITNGQGLSRTPRFYDGLVKTGAGLTTKSLIHIGNSSVPWSSSHFNYQESEGTDRRQEGGGRTLLEIT